jgi:stage II sporulation protein D
VIKKHGLDLILGFATLLLVLVIACNRPNRNTRTEPTPQSKMLKSGQIIRVALQYKVKSFSLQTVQPYKISPMASTQVAKERASGTLRFDVHAGQLRLNGQVFSGGDCFLKHSKEEHSWKLGKERYRGSIRVKVLKDKSLALILHSDLEPYVASVVSGESGPFFSEEALKCQAVVSRTFAMYRKRKEPRARSLFDVFPDTRDQVFKGLSSLRGKHIRAANSTHNLVLNWQGKLLGTFYHSTCGGHTVNAKEIRLVLKPTAPLMGLSCKWCSDSPFYGWKHQVSVFQMIQKIPTLKGQTVLSMRVEKTKSGLVKAVFVKTNIKEHRYSSYHFRRAIGSGKMRSSRFTCQIKDRNIYFTGHGFGHGVGLCQYGSQGMANAGKKYKSILNYYFPGSTLNLNR